MRTSPPLLAPLFRSDGQARILSCLFLGDEELSITELADRTGLAYATVHREIGRLLDAGLISEDVVGRTRVLRQNPSSPLHKPLRELLLIATGPVPLLKQELASVEGVQTAFVFGSFAARMKGKDGPAPHDIDLMVIGNPDPEAVYDVCQRVEAEVARPVNPVITTRKEFDQDSGFHQQVRDSPILPIIGDAPWW